MTITRFSKNNSLQRITNNCEMVIYDSTGGTKTTVGSDIVHSFTTTGSNSLTLNLKPNYINSRVISGSRSKVHVLLIGGGGGGFTGGGGGGGFVYSSSSPSDSSNTITVGTGGASGGGNAVGGTASNGGDSIGLGLTATGGGGGGGSATVGANGASGGGNGMDTAGSARRTGIAGQGYDGGTSNANGYGGGGGGGGAGQQGSDAYGPNGNGSDPGNGGDGGFGRASNITGTESYYGGGGAGGVNTNNDNNKRVRPFGGRGGGANGAYSANESGISASANTGGGGGGKEWESSGNGGIGGSGIVIVRYTPNIRSTSTVKFDYSDKDGSTAAKAAASVHQLKASFPNTTNGIYYIMHNGTAHQFYVDFTTEGGPWILVCKMPSSNATYGYDHAMWTNTSGGVTTGPTDLSTTDEYYLSSAFYTYSTFVTRISMYEPTRWNAIVHSSSATVQSLANGTFNSVSGSQGATGTIAANSRAMPGTYKPLGLTDAVVASGNKATSAGTYHRYGFMPNSADRWGHDIRIGWSADNDNSDSGDTVCGFGFKAYGSAPGSTGYSGGAGCGWSYYSSWTSGSGSTSGNLKGWIWVRA